MSLLHIYLQKLDIHTFRKSLYFFEWGILYMCSLFFQPAPINEPLHILYWLSDLLRPAPLETTHSFISNTWGMRQTTNRVEGPPRIPIFDLREVFSDAKFRVAHYGKNLPCHCSVTSMKYQKSITYAIRFLFCHFTQKTVEYVRVLTDEISV